MDNRRHSHPWPRDVRPSVLGTSQSPEHAPPGNKTLQHPSRGTLLHSCPHGLGAPWNVTVQCQQPSFSAEARCSWHMPRVSPPAGDHPCTPRGASSSSETSLRAAAASRVHGAQHRWVTAYYAAAVTAGDLSGRSDSAASGAFSADKCRMGFNLTYS